MSDNVIDLTASDNEQGSANTSAPGTSESKPNGGTRRGSRSASRRGRKPPIEPEVAIDGSKATTRRRRMNLDACRQVESKSKTEPNGRPPSLLSRLGIILNENEKENTKSKQTSRGRPPATTAKVQDTRVRGAGAGAGAESKTGAYRRRSRSRSPSHLEDVALSELAVDQLCFVDTGPSDSLEPESNVPGAKPSKKKSARLGKQDHAQKMGGKVPGDSTSNDTPKEVEFVGGSALVVEGGISSVAPATEIDTLTNGDIVKPTHVEQGNTESLSLPAHVTIWAEGDPDLPLEEVVAEPEEGVEYLDYEGDQATGAARYFAPELSTSTKRRCLERLKTYIYLTEDERIQVLKEREELATLAFGQGGEGFIARHIWCYNCGNAGHWGDDCKDAKPRSTPSDPCAFGSFNASRGPFGGSDDGFAKSRDAPRPAWMDDDPHLQNVGRRAKEANIKRNQVAEASRQARERNDDDDWFSRNAGFKLLHETNGPAIALRIPRTFHLDPIHRPNRAIITWGQAVARLVEMTLGVIVIVTGDEIGIVRETVITTGVSEAVIMTTRDKITDGENTMTIRVEEAIDATTTVETGGEITVGETGETIGTGLGRNTEDPHMSEKASAVSVHVESYDGEQAHTGHTKRVLNARQVQLFSIGGTIGTSIFVAIGSALVHGGPLSLLLGYAFWCSVIFCVNEGQAEMVCLLPIESSFNRFATRWVDRAFGAATSWNYWICMAALFNFEITAFTAVIGFWTDDVHPVVFPIAMLTTYALLNLWSAKFFGETEFWISLMKVILIIGLLIMTFFLMVGVNPHRDAFGFRYWRDPGPMAEYISTGDLGRFQGLFSCVLSAAFAVAGPDMLSIIAGEAKAPRRIMPKAFRTVFVRLILFFVLGSLAVGILVPYNDPILNAAIKEGQPGAARSPYVAALTRLNVPVLPHIINAMILTSIFSAGNAFLFNGSRTLHGLALDGFAPSFIRQTNRNGVPWVAVTITLIIGCLSFLQVNENTSKVLDWFINVATSAQLVTWIAMCITWIRWNAAMKAQGVTRDILPYTSKFQPYGAWYGLVVSVIVTFFNGYYVFLKGGWATADFIFAYGSVFIFIGIYIGVKVLRHSPFVAPDQADLFSGKKEIDEYEANLVEEPPKTRLQRVLRWLF
ncbi:General amino acid permease AGP2 [Ceratobasidium theobromae]|uniref:General amino acid permease AGP2 n=1 Tax=Ceratobasidium theobromae TaxID=1582974 RepID=A0A5N5QW04_9AGAM|nr:General amino acid permease AGP2 [Ceratobasidium theobromae]